METEVLIIGGIFAVPAYAIMLKFVWDLWTTKKESYDIPE